MTDTSRFTIQWEGYYISGNPRVNPGAKDRNLVRCMGDTPMEAHSADEAARIFRNAFPDTRIISIN